MARFKAFVYGILGGATGYVMVRTEILSAGDAVRRRMKNTGRVVTGKPLVSAADEARQTDDEMSRILGKSGTRKWNDLVREMYAEVVYRL